jgi:hypothetical protein
VNRKTIMAIGISAAAAALLAGPGAFPGSAYAVGAGQDRMPSTRAQCCSPHPGHFVVDGARIRSAPRTHSVVLGLGQRSHRVTVWCTVAGFRWFNLTDDSTGVRGWSSSDVVIRDFDGHSVGECAPPAATPPTHTTPENYR